MNWGKELLIFKKQSSERLRRHWHISFVHGIPPKFKWEFKDLSNWIDQG